MQIPVWTVRRLRNTLQALLSQVEEHCHICFFLDGLDELIGDQDELIELMEQMRSKTVKICLSSRPDRIYQNAFGRSARLILQDLTKADITAYVNGKLKSKLESKLQCWKMTDRLRCLLIDIVKKAMGVFLWVELVVRDLLIGLANEDSFVQLEQRVNQMPSSIRGLYTWMLGRIDPCYRTEASSLLLMTLSGHTRSFLDIAPALDEDLHNSADLSIQRIMDHCEKMRNRIPTITAGLCEVFSLPNHTIKKEGRSRELWIGSNQDQRLWYNLGSSLTLSETDVPLELSKLQYYEVIAEVNLHHRTATEFLQRSEQARNFLSSYTPPNFDPLTAYVHALLTKMQLLGFPKVDSAQSSEHPDDSEYYDKNVAVKFSDSLMGILFFTELDTGVPQALLCEDVDRALSTYYRQLYPSSPESHWSVRWGMWRENSLAYRKPRSYNRDTYVTRATNFVDQLYDIIHHSRLVYPEISSSRRENLRDRLYGAAIKLKIQIPTPKRSLADIGTRFTMFNTSPANFTEYAACYGLHCYLFDLLEKQPKVYTTEALDGLLLCAIESLVDLRCNLPYCCTATAIPERRTPFALITKLLRMGSNPQSWVKGLSTSIWGYYLMQLVATSFWKCTDETKEAAARTTKQFLLHGSDRQETQLVEMVLRLYGLEELHMGPRLGSRKYYYEIIFFDWHNVMSVTEELFRNTPEYESLRQLCLEVGIEGPSVDTYIGFQEDDFKPYRMSEPQCGRFITAYRRYIQAGSALPNEENREWAHQLTELYKEVHEGQDEVNHSGSMEEEYRTESEGEDEPKIESETK